MVDGGAHYEDIMHNIELMMLRLMFDFNQLHDAILNLV